MPSPFPGMDPYLEGDLWPDVHHELAVAVKYQLRPLLRPRYYPFTERYYLPEGDDLEIVEQRIMPDVGIVKQRAGRGTVAEANGASTPVILELPAPAQRAQYRIAIRDVEKRRLVTAIEFLSPTNKRGEGREKYLRKREKILNSSAHLVEVDLLRRGRRLPVKGKLPAGCYYVYVSRAQERPKIRVWPIALDAPLPVLPIPLKKKNEEVLLDLGNVFTTVYDMGGYDDLANYRRPPDVPLEEADARWVDRLLREKGLRK